LVNNKPKTICKKKKKAHCAGDEIETNGMGLALGA
jgi:hypothetical protein